MKVIRSGGAAFRAIVENCPAWAQIGQEQEKGIHMGIDPLRPMIHMGHGEMGREDGHGVAEDQVFASIANPLLTLGEMIEAQEASPLTLAFRTHIRGRALEPSGVVLETNGKPATIYVPLPDIF
jgi:hypothetical protein